MYESSHAFYIAVNSEPLQIASVPNLSLVFQAKNHCETICSNRRQNNLSGLNRLYRNGLVKQEYIKVTNDVITGIKALPVKL